MFRNRLGHRISLVAGMALGIVLTWSAQSIAQRPTSSRHNLAVDEVRLTNGKRMYGIVVQQNSQTGVQMIVKRSWFENTYPHHYASHLDSERKSEIDGYTRQLFRLEAWWKSRVTDTKLVEFIDSEMARLEKLREDRKLKGKVGLKPFTLVSYPAEDVQGVYIQPPENRKLAGLGWKHRVDRVSSRSIPALKRELEKKNVDIDQETFDLSSELPGRFDQPDREWNIRVAIIEFQIRESLEFQGVGSNLIRVDANQPANQMEDFQSVMGQLMNSGLGQTEQLDELLDELGLKSNRKKSNDRWWKKAAEIADAEGYSGFAVKRLVTNNLASTVTVEICFFARTAPGEWTQIRRVSSSANRKHVEQASVDRLKADPRVEQVLAIAKTIGLHADETIDQALRQGAATEVAMKAAEESFYEFISRFSKQTDSPTLDF